MSFRRPRLRSRRHVIDIRFGDEPCYVWLPDPDEPLVIAEFADAANLASAVLSTCRSTKKCSCCSTNVAR